MISSASIILRRSPRYDLSTASHSIRSTKVIVNARFSRFNSSSTTPPSIKDPSHPYLHYHPFTSPSPGKLALSFLSSRPVPGSKTILGYLPMVEGTLQDFKEEPKFMDVLHDSIKSGLEAGKAECVIFEASTRPSDGYIHITDERAIPPAGRIGEPEDLIASVFVQDGKILPETYSATPTYRIVTSNGPLILPKGLGEWLIKDLEKIDKEEKGE